MSEEKLFEMEIKLLLKWNMFNNYFELNLSISNNPGSVQNYLVELLTLLLNFRGYLGKSTCYTAKIFQNETRNLEKQLEK
jgi:hypothetical protein